MKNGYPRQARLRLERVFLVLAVLGLLGGCAFGGGCPVSPHLGIHAEARLRGGAKTPLILKDSHYTIPPITERPLPPSFGCPVIPPDLLRAKPRKGT